MSIDPITAGRLIAEKLDGTALDIEEGFEAAGFVERLPPAQFLAICERVDEIVGRCNDCEYWTVVGELRQHRGACYGCRED